MHNDRSFHTKSKRMSRNNVFDPIDKVWRRRKVVNYSRVKKGVGEVVYKGLLNDLQHICQVR